MADSSLGTGDTDRGRLRATAAVLRLGTMQARLSLGFTYCTMAEAEIACGRADQARTTLHRARRIGEFVRRHLTVPNHVPSIALSELREQLAQLERRVVTIALRLTHAAE